MTALVLTSPAAADPAASVPVAVERDSPALSRPAPLRTTPLAEAAIMISYLRRSEIFRDYRRAFVQTTGLPLALRPAGPAAPPAAAGPRMRSLSSLIARSHWSPAGGRAMQQWLRAGAPPGPGPRQCPAGLAESAIPVWTGGKLVGYLQTGQVLLRPPTSQRFTRLLDDARLALAGCDRRKLQRVYFQTRRVARDQYASILSLLSIFAQHLAAVGHQVLVSTALAEQPAMGRARAFIRDHHREDLHLPDVARAVNMDVFHFCKTFKQVTRLTFTDYRARVRVETVKELLGDPHTRVTEAAYAAGFNSLSQFNRTFRRIEGESPTIFRRRLHTPPGPAAG